MAAECQLESRVLIADRDQMSSDLLSNALIRSGGFEAMAVRPADLLMTLAAHEVGLVVLAAESSSNEGSGLDLAHAICSQHPDTLVVVLLNSSTRDSVINAFRSGARGVFCRQQPMTDFLDCIHRVRNGFIWAGKQETDFLVEAFRSIPSGRVTTLNSPLLTTREMQVVQIAAKGKTNKAIAQELGLSEHTVKNYLFKSFEKLGVSSRVELLFYLTMGNHTFAPAQSERVEISLVTS